MGLENFRWMSFNFGLQVKHKLMKERLWTPKVMSLAFISFCTKAVTPTFPHPKKEKKGKKNSN